MSPANRFEQVVNVSKNRHQAMCCIGGDLPIVDLSLKAYTPTLHDTAYRLHCDIFLGAVVDKV